MFEDKDRCICPHVCKAVHPHLGGNYYLFVQEQPSSRGLTGGTVASSVRKLLKVPSSTVEGLFDDSRDLDSLEGSPGCRTDVLHLLVVNSY